jgi:hypothetical protein
LPKGTDLRTAAKHRISASDAAAAKAFPSYLLDRLNRDAGSPLEHKIQTPTTPDGVIKDNSMLECWKTV